MKASISTALIILLSALALRGQGTILWDESVNGSISSDYISPTVFGILNDGTNFVIGSVSNARVGDVWVGPEDFFVFQVPTQSSLAAVYVSVDKSDIWAWLGNSSFSTELGFVPNSATGDLIGQWAIASIGPGIYGMYMANRDRSIDSSIAAYRLDFVIQAVPEPSSLWLLLGGLGLVGIQRWRTSKLLTP